MSMYNKIFTKILDSSIWLESQPTRIVWLTLIATMDEHGFCQFAAVGNLANRARVTLEEARAAIECLQNPDAESSDPDNDGRRIERVPGGWMVLNAEKHRAMVTRAVIQAQTRARVTKHRAKKRTGNAQVTPSVSISEARSETETEINSVSSALTNSAKPAVTTLAILTASILAFPTVGPVKTWDLTEAHVAEWSEAYPNLDIFAEAIKAKAWINASPERRKTAKGMSRFLVGWFGRAVNRGSSPQFGPGPSKTGDTLQAGRDSLKDRLARLEDD